MKFKILCVLLLSGLTACAQIPTNEGVEKTGESAESEETGHLNLPRQELTAPVLFDFLVGETALQRGNLDIAVNRYVNEVERLMHVLERRLGESEYVGGPDYSIVDMALWPSRRIIRRSPWSTPRWTPPH